MDRPATHLLGAVLVLACADHQRLWSQLGAAIAMLENAMAACPDALWGDRAQTPQFWYVVYHTLFYLDLYASDSPNGFAPPPPFTLSELDAASELPERVYTKDELFAYLEHGRNKSRAAVEALTDESTRRLRSRLGLPRERSQQGQLTVHSE